MIHIISAMGALSCEAVRISYCSRSFYRVPIPTETIFVMVDLNIRLGPFQVFFYESHPTPTNVHRQNEHQHRRRPLIVQLPSAPERTIPDRSTARVPERNGFHKAQDLELDLK